MPSFKATLLGIKQSGKTELFHKLSISNYANHKDQAYIPTVGPDVNSLRINNEINQEPLTTLLWDTPGNPRLKSLSVQITVKSDFGLFCIDLSSEMNEEEFNQFESYIQEFRERNPTALLVLVGTKSDIAPVYALQNISDQLSDIPFAKVIATSARDKNGSDELHNFLAAEINQKVARAQALLSVNDIQRAQNRCAQHPSLYQALDKLNRETQHIKPEVARKLEAEALTLINNLFDDETDDKSLCISSFIEKSNLHLNGEYHQLKNAILTVAITVTVTVIAAMIGFGIGFALGAWSGPGAFFAGLAAGTASALAVSGGASLLGLRAFAYTAQRFFQPSPEMESVNEVAQQAQAITHCN